jgi:hypothetical protein
VRIGLGFLLVVTAGLKLNGLSTSAVPQVGWFAQPWVQLFTAQWELVLGAWLLSGIGPRWSWFTALVTFLAFAGVSGYLAWVGVASCGCFGAIKASPWWAFGVDVAALLALGLARPPVLVQSQPASRLGHLRTGAACVIICSVIITSYLSLVHGSAEIALAKLRGDPFAVERRYLDYGPVLAGDVVEQEVVFHNFSSRPLRIYGGTSDCSCVTTHSLPLVIPPDATGRVPVILKVPGGEGAFTRTAELRTDSERHPVVRLVIGCRVVGSADASAHAAPNSP